MLARCDCGSHTLFFLSSGRCCHIVFDSLHLAVLSHTTTGNNRKRCDYQHSEMNDGNAFQRTEPLHRSLLCVFGCEGESKNHRVQWRIIVNTAYKQTAYTFVNSMAHRAHTLSIVELSKSQHNSHQSKSQFVCAAERQRKTYVKIEKEMHR